MGKANDLMIDRMLSKRVVVIRITRWEAQDLMGSTDHNFLVLVIVMRVSSGEKVAHKRLKV